MSLHLKCSWFCIESHWTIASVLIQAPTSNEGSYRRRNKQHSDTEKEWKILNQLAEIAADIENQTSYYSFQSEEGNPVFDMLLVDVKVGFPIAI